MQYYNLRKRIDLIMGRMIHRMMTDIFLARTRFNPLITKVVNHKQRIAKITIK